MKTNLLHKAAVCVGVAVALSAVTARADEPQKESSTATSRKQVAATTRHAAKPAEKKAATTATPTRDGRSAHYAPGGIVNGSNGHEHAVLTGSQIPRDYNRRGYSTDSSDSEFIYDKNDIRLRSTLNVQDSLRSVPGVSVGGMR